MMLFALGFLACVIVVAALNYAAPDLFNKILTGLGVVAAAVAGFVGYVADKL